MRLTLLLSVIMMAGLFLLLYAGVGFLRDKKYFTSAPKEIQALLPDYIPERFPGAHAVGWILAVISILLLAGPILYGGYDGIIKGFSFGQFFLRFLIMLESLKGFDVLFFDWYLLSHSNFFPHFFPEIPELKDAMGPQLFGFNKKSQIRAAITYIMAALLLALICTLIG